MKRVEQSARRGDRIVLELLHRSREAVWAGVAIFFWRSTKKCPDLYAQETQAFGRLNALHSLVVNSAFASRAKLTYFL